MERRKRITIGDWYGDPGVIGGTADCRFKRCKQCGKEAGLEPGEGIPDDDYDY